MADKYYTPQVREEVKRMSRRYEKDLAHILSRVFAIGAEKYELGAYIDAAMQSEVMTEFDMPMSEYHWCGMGQLAYLIEEELKETDKIPPRASDRQLENQSGAQAIGEWAAYLYMRMHVSYGLAGSEANEILSGNDIIDAWYVYHTLDLDEAIDEMTSGHLIGSETAIENKD